MKQRGTPAAWKTPERLFRGLFSPGGKCGSGACFYLLFGGGCSGFTHAPASVVSGEDSHGVPVLPVVPAAVIPGGGSCGAPE
ncbi:hypothetical protein CE91St17_22350 [Alistipes onderdonkii]|nr:hypothetical protein CE91St18_26900 [Alistipes onderdonkii]GKG97173.1 hypothetical protein CE91St17_22350 [Alistipes onderdonkii]